MSPEGFGWELTEWIREISRLVVLVFRPCLNRSIVSKINQVGKQIFSCDSLIVRMTLTESHVGPPIKGGASRPAELSGDVLVGGLAPDVLRKKGLV